MSVHFASFAPPGFPLPKPPCRDPVVKPARTVVAALSVLRVRISVMNKTFFVAALWLPALAAQAEIVDIRWSAEGRFEHRATVAPAKFVELCGKFPAALRVHWRFEANAPLDFNIHYHVGKEVVYAAQLKAVAAAHNSLLTALEQDHCWMWTNKSLVVATLSVQLQRH